MQESYEAPDQKKDIFKPVADIFFSYLFDLIYKPSSAVLKVENLPEAFSEFASGLHYLGCSISETRALARELAMGNLNCTLPPPSNEIAAPLKMLHSSLRHLTWQTQQVAKGDYNQHVTFMGDFADAFNNMIEQLEQRRKIFLDEKTKLEMYVHLIIVNCPNPILLFDSEGKLAYVSDSFFRYCTIFGKDEVLGKKLRDLFTPIVSGQSMNEIEHLYLDAAAEERMFMTEQEINFGNPGYSSYFKIQITPMPDTVGKAAGIVMFLFDITESIEARREAERARELAEQSSRAKSIFLAKMSHEIRTPMNAILGMSELALREEVSPAAEEHIRIIRQAGINLLSIINDILDFSKIEAGKLEIIPMEYFLSSLIHDVINIIKTRIHESRLRFVAHIDCNLPNGLYGDSIRIRQILLNLLSNAAKYTEKGFVSFYVSGEITDDDTVNLMVKVSDSGKGIKPEERDRLFTEFSRFDEESNRSVEGTGLGLAICRNLVAAMDGKIEVQSEYGAGSTFTVSIPQKIRKYQKLAVVENPERKKVLIYERRLIYANSISQTMENLGVGYKLVSDPSDFYSRLITGEYPFIILAFTLYEDLKNKYSNLNSNAKFAVIADFGEVITDRSISTLTMPIFSIPVANFLNGVSGIFSSRTKRENTTGLISPDAKVMVVDDIDTNLEVAEGLLQPYKVQVKLCKSGKAAINEIRTTHCDLILMDLMMPGMDGIETVSNIRALGKNESYYENVPIIALTADAVIGTKEMLLEKGFDDFLSKPIDITQLSTIMEKWIPKEKQKNPVMVNYQSAVPDRQTINKKIKIDGLDTEKGIALIGGKAEMYLKMLSTFHDDGTMKINEIKSCLETENMQLYAIHVHALKSACALVGAAALSETAAVLEEAGKMGDLKFIHTHNPAFLGDLEKLLRTINTALSENAEKERDKLIERELLNTVLIRLKTALINFDSPEINKTVNTLEDYTELTDIGDPIKAILQNRLIGEYDETVSMIDDLIRKINA